MEVEFCFKRDTCRQLNKQSSNENWYRYSGLLKLRKAEGVAAIQLTGQTGHNKQGWLLSGAVEGVKREKPRREAMDAGRDRGEEGWPDSSRLVGNITSPLGATTATMLIFLPPSSFYPPTSYLYSFYLPVSLSCSLSGHLSLLASLVPCCFLSSLPSLLYSSLASCHPVSLFCPEYIYACLDVSLIFCPLPLCSSLASLPLSSAISLSQSVLPFHIISSPNFNFTIALTAPTKCTVYSNKSVKMSYLNAGCIYSIS